MVATSSRRSTRAARTSTGSRGRQQKKKKVQQKVDTSRPVQRWFRVRRAPAPGIGFEVWTWKRMKDLTDAEKERLLPKKEPNPSINLSTPSSVATRDQSFPSEKSNTSMFQDTPMAASTDSKHFGYKTEDFASPPARRPRIELEAQSTVATPRSVGNGSELSDPGASIAATADLEKPVTVDQTTSLGQPAALANENIHIPSHLEPAGAPAIQGEPGTETPNQETTMIQQTKDLEAEESSALEALNQLAGATFDPSF